MRKCFTYLLPFIAIVALASCDKKDEVAPEPVLVDKTAVFEVFATEDYTNSYYADHEATIHLRIYRGQKWETGEPVVFDSTFTMLLKDIPMEDEQIVIRKTIPAVDTNKEWVSLGSGSRVGSVGYGSYEPVPDEELTSTTEIVF